VTRPAVYRTATLEFHLTTSPTAPVTFCACWDQYGWLFDTASSSLTPWEALGRAINHAQSLRLIEGSPLVEWPASTSRQTLVGLGGFNV